MSIFPTKILLATDGSLDAQLALQTAVNLAKSTSSEMHIATVSPGGYTPTYRVYANDPYYKALIRDLQREAQELLHEQGRKIEEVGGTVAGVHLKMGERPDREIVQLSEEIGAGLVVIGSRGLGGLRRALMGSVSNSVVRHAHCPVLVVRGRGNEELVFSAKKILLATDGSEESTLAARTAADIADKTTSELHVVYTEPVPVYGELPSGRFETSEAVEREVRNRTQRFLDDQMNQIEAGGGTVAQAHLRMGRPDEEIVALAEEIGAGLVVMGSRGLGGMRRALMGSVSDSVVRHAHCPVLVVRKEEPEEVQVEEAGPEEVGLV